MLFSLLLYSEGELQIRVERCKQGEPSCSDELYIYMRPSKCILNFRSFLSHFLSVKSFIDIYSTYITYLDIYVFPIISVSNSS